jgi:hypothetical protein
VLWASLITGVIVIQMQLGGGIPTGKNVPGAGLHPILIVGLMEIAAACVVRWWFLPRTSHYQRQLVLMVIGMALGEGAAIMGVILVPRDLPETRLWILLLSLLAMLQFAPTYAGRSKAANPFRADLSGR